MASKLKAKAPELVRPGKIKMAIYGAPGVGKTTLALSFPTPYYYDIEGGARGAQYRELLKAAGGAYMGVEDGTLSFDTMFEQMQALATEKHPYRTFIADSITKLYQSTIAQEVERLGDKDAFGASKKPAVGAMRRLFMWGARLDMNQIYICHEATEWGLLNGQRSELGKIPDIYDKMSYELDLVVHAQRRGPSRVALIKKSRIAAFPEGDSFPLEYAEFAARFGRENVEADSAPIVLAKPEQVAEVMKLLEIVKVDAADIEKGFAKAGVSSWPEMTSDQITVWQNFLKKRIAA